MTLQWSVYAIKTFQDASDYIANNLIMFQSLGRP